MQPDSKKVADPKGSEAPPAQPASAGIQIPDHELLRPIDHGSYGQVWLARNMMGAYRAVKIVHRSGFQDDRPFERELAGIEKFEPISRSHDGFIDVLHVGRNHKEGYFYYVMEVGDDETNGQNIHPETYRPKTLASVAPTGTRLPVAECARLSMALLEALHQLHQNGLTHRDIKPSNLIFVNGTPRLADIGLVTDIGQGQSYVGTEGYIPPEGPGTPQADIYALGKVLYEISTGKDRQAFPELPEDFTGYADAEAFREFNEVVLRACSAEAAKRYHSARQMQEELTVLMGGGSLRRLRVLERRWKAFKRVAPLAAGVAIILITLSYLVYGERRLAAETRERQIGANVADGIARLKSGDMAGALASFTRTLLLKQGTKEREETERLRCAAVLARSPKLIQMWSQSPPVHWLEFSPDGEQLLVTEKEDRAQIRNLKDGSIVPFEFSVGSAVTASFSRDGRYVVTAGSDEKARLFEAKSGNEVHVMPHPNYVMCATFSPDGSRIVTGSSDAQVRVWSKLTGELLAQLSGHSGRVLSVCFSHDGLWLLSTSEDRTARLWDGKSGVLVGELRHSSWVYGGGFSPDDRFLVTACFDRKARVWEVSTGRLWASTPAHGDGIRSAEYSPDGLLILTASFDGIVHLWDAATLMPTPMSPVFRHSARVTFACFSPEGNRIATGCYDGTTRVWDLAANSLTPVLTKKLFSPDGSHFARVSTNFTPPWNALPVGLPTGVDCKAQWSANGKWLVTLPSGDPAGTEVALWNVASGERRVLRPHLDNAPNLAQPSNDGRFLALCESTNCLVMEVKTERPLFEPLRYAVPISQVFFNRDGTRLVVVSGRDMHVLDAKTGRPALNPLSYPAYVQHAEYSPNELWLVSCFADEQLNECWAQVTDANTGRPIGEPLRHRDGVLYASFSPDGRRVVTSSEDFTARVWDARTGRPITPPLEHDNQIKGAGFSPNGRYVVTASVDRSARVWDAVTGELLVWLPDHPALLWEGRFVVDNQHLLLGDRLDSAWYWSLPVDHRSAKDLASLADLLAGASPSDEQSIRVSAVSAGAAQVSLWHQLKNKYPDDFRTTPADILAWHRKRAEQSQSEQRWSAAIFHLNILSKAEPGNLDLAKQLDTAKAKLAAIEHTANH